MENVFKILSRIIIIALIVTGIYLFAMRNYVIIRFDELGPVTKNMSAYYNGFKIGKVTKISPDKDFKHTLVRVNFIHKVNIPQNSIVSVETFPNGELYLKFRYPQSPSLYRIKRGDIIEGMSPSSIEQFMMGQNVSGVSDVVSLNVIKALNAADAANRQMQEFFKVTSTVIQNNGKGINASVNNIADMTQSFAEMAENLNQASAKLNKSITVSNLKGTTVNVKDASANIKDATKNIKDASQNIKNATVGIKATTDSIAHATKDIDKTMKTVDMTVNNANSTAENLNTLTGGLNKTLSKRFGGMRVMFGTAIDKNECQTRKCSK